MKTFECSQISNHPADVLTHSSKEPNLNVNRVTFQRVYKVAYLGYAVLDRRYTLPMLPWVIAEIKRFGGQNAEQIFLEVADSSLKATNSETNTLVFEHKLQTISKFAQTTQDSTCFTYMTKEVACGPCAYHVFQALEECIVLELFMTLREMTKEMVQQQSLRTAAPLKSSSGTSLDSIMSSGLQYEVLYLGRIKVSSKRAPPTFIDDAVEKFRLNEIGKLRKSSGSSSSARERHSSGSSVSSGLNFDLIDLHETDVLSQSSSKDSLKQDLSDNMSIENEWNESLLDLPNKAMHKSNSEPLSILPVITRSESDTFIKGVGTNLSSAFNIQEAKSAARQPSTVQLLMAPSSLIPHTQSLDVPSCANIVHDLDDIVSDNVFKSRTRSCSGDIPRPAKQTSLPAYRVRTGSGGSSQITRPGAFSSTCSSIQQKNRTMLFLIGHLEICLIGMDKKQVILGKTFNDIAHCSQGIRYLDHFGFICRETTLAGADCYTGYIFQCQTERVVDEIMQSLKLAFKRAHHDYQHNGVPKSSDVPRLIVCEGCPMQWYHKLCSDVEGLQPENIHYTILMKLNTLSVTDRDEIMQKCDVADVNSLQEQNEVLMMVLREFCEQKQAKHIHQTNGCSKNGEKSTSSKLDTLRQKAKKSISSSFETFANKLKNRDEGRIRSLTTISDCSPVILSTPDEVFHREGSYDGPDHITGQSSPLPQRPRSSTFSTTHEARKASTKHSKKSSSQTKSPIFNMFMKVGHQNTTPSSSGDESDSPSRKGSWRQVIFHRIHTPIQSSKSEPTHKLNIVDFNLSDVCGDLKMTRKRTRAELRELWRKAILEQILLIRMEKENKKLQVSQDAVSHKRMKLDYHDVTPCLKESLIHWEKLLNNPDRLKIKIDKENLLNLVKDGVPRIKRGEIWQLLAEQDMIWSPMEPYEGYDVPYESLLRQLTSHQHAILIDLGRTFPSHPFYSQPLGPGQLSLFNLLKAYSLLDGEVGYCQGLSFVAGILLLHMPEEKAFLMMKHILFNLGLRKQYKPDMVALQLQMYQLSRLMHDNYRDVYNHLERHDIAPTLYAAPWFLTLFASQFSLGFVSRLFDLIFLHGLDTIFKAALVLMGNHRELLLQCHGFEAIMEFLKTSLPSLSAIEMQRVFNQIIALDISKQLHAYEVEYHVLKEEMMFNPSKSDVEVVQKLEMANRNLKVQNMELLEQLQVAHSTIHNLEGQEISYKSTVQRLECRLAALEEERDAYLHTLGLMKHRLQKLEVASLESAATAKDGEGQEESHAPSFHVVYALAGSEKEEDLQLKQLIRDFCEDRQRKSKDDGKDVEENDWVLIKEEKDHDENECPISVSSNQQRSGESQQSLSNNNSNVSNTSVSIGK